MKKILGKILACLAITTALAGRLAGAEARAAEDLGKTFAAPPTEYKPWCYWWWLNGAASKEGITRDFEEMRKQGISGALLFDAGEVDKKIQQGPPFMSEAWRELFRYAVREADRCGITLTVNLCTGWDAGGPWVTPEHAMKKLVASAPTVVQGPGRVSVELPQPQIVKEFYHDISVLAMPLPETSLPVYKLVASSQQAGNDSEKAQDFDDKTYWQSKGSQPGLDLAPENPEYLQFDFDAPCAAAGVYLKGAQYGCGPKEVEVQSSDDGQTFRSLKHQTLTPGEASSVFFEETRAKHFRVLFLSAYPYGSDRKSNFVRVAEIALLPKQLVDKTRSEQLQWDSKKAVDVSRFMDGNGRLDWEAPAGRWRVMRIGYTLTGRPTVAAGSGPSGPEIDPLNAEAMDLHFANTGAKLIADAGPLAGKTLQYFHIDSWEKGYPSWTLKMREEFQRRRGYDPLPFLPAMVGWTVDNAEATKRFVQDFRRTVADLVAENYYGRMAELTCKGGLRGTHSESGGPGNHWIDALQCLSSQAVPMGEFWLRASSLDEDAPHPANASVKGVASAAHIYGKPLCQAETFTTLGDDFTESPWGLKKIGDEAFCYGLKRMVFHNWPTQLHPDVRPGIWFTHVGTHFGYKLTWWPMADGWLTYLARCQYLLRQGLFVADFAYLQDESIPSFVVSPRYQKPERPKGFEYDAMNAEVLLTRASVKDGRLMLPNGMSYRYLVLPHQPEAILSPATLKKINELAEAGVPVIGPKSFAESVPKVREGALEGIVRADGLAPDIEFRPAPSALNLQRSDFNLPASNFDWIHRRDGETEIYFISNQRTLDAKAEVVFRVSGKQPELWDAVTGMIADLPEWREEKGRTLVPMAFAPRQSFFVVFRKAANLKAETGNRKNFPELKAVQELAGPWDVQFDPHWFYPDNGTGGKVRFDQLVDWTKRPEEAIKYYSGIAVYKKTFDQKSEAQKLVLSLGELKNLARVRLNGRDLGVVWCAPWQVEIPAGLLKSADNELEIEVANLWPNRLIGDASLPPDKRRIVTNVATYESVNSDGFRGINAWARGSCKSCSERMKTGKPADLLPSGLLGPVRVMSAE
ncbi:MAG: glycosyl hydrolase [Verrucomicrobiae bacterium]